MFRSLTTAFAVVLAVAFSGGAFAQQAPKHLKNEWALGYYDGQGNATTALGGAEEVAFVRGPKDFVLEIGCRPNNEGLFYRVGRRMSDELDFAGEELTPTITIRDAGKVRFTKELISVKFRAERGIRTGSRLTLAENTD